MIASLVLAYAVMITIFISAIFQVFNLPVDSLTWVTLLTIFSVFLFSRSKASSLKFKSQAGTMLQVLALVIVLGSYIVNVYAYMRVRENGDFLIHSLKTKALLVNGYSSIFGTDYVNDLVVGGTVFYPNTASQISAALSLLFELDTSRAVYVLLVLSVIFTHVFLYFLVVAVSTKFVFYMGVLIAASFNYLDSIFLVNNLSGILALMSASACALAVTLNRTKIHELNRPTRVVLLGLILFSLVLVHPLSMTYLIILLMLSTTLRFRVRLNPRDYLNSNLIRTLLPSLAIVILVLASYPKICATHYSSDRKIPFLYNLVDESCVVRYKGGINLNAQDFLEKVIDRLVSPIIIPKFGYGEVGTIQLREILMAFAILTLLVLGRKKNPFLIPYLLTSMFIVFAIPSQIKGFEIFKLLSLPIWNSASRILFLHTLLLAFAIAHTLHHFVLIRIQELR